MFDQLHLRHMLVADHGLAMTFDGFAEPKGLGRAPGEADKGDVRRLRFIALVVGQAALSELFPDLIAQAGQSALVVAFDKPRR